MATTVGSHSVSAFATPVNGGPLDANVVRGNDNTIRTAYVAHDADTGIHVQSSSLASRPSAGTAGRKWITVDTGSYKLWYDDGTTWHEVGTATIDVFVIADENLVKGDIVKVTGYNNGAGAPRVAKVASASDVAFGIVNQTIASGATGYLTNTGLITDVATNTFNVGDILYPNTSGGLTTTKPTSGNYQPSAFVLRSNANNGVLYVEFSAPRIVERSDNTASTIVLRDASGNFSAGTITAGALTSTGLVTFASLKGTGATTVTNILDEDNMASDSATALATQQSIKAYVDAKVATVDTLAEVLANGNTTGANDIIVTAGQKITTNTIDETTSGSGVTIDSVLLKDDVVNATDIETGTVSANDGTLAITVANSTGALTLATALADSNLATISTAGKVSNSATTATATNTNSAIVARDGSGNFAAGTITAALSGNASTATALQTARNINGVSFNGTADITVTAAAGTLSGTTLASGVKNSSLETVGTLSSLTVSGNSAIGGTIGTGVRLRVVGAPGASSGFSIGTAVEPTLSGTTQSVALSTGVAIAASVTATDARGINVDNANLGSGAAITTQYGVYINAQTNGSTNWALYTAGTTPSYFGGNLGLGVTPKTWFGGNRAMQLGNGASITGYTGNNSVEVRGNSYVNSDGNNAYSNNGRASIYAQDAGEHKWFTSPASGTANVAFTATQAMTLDASGNLLVGLTSSASTGRVKVIGTIRVADASPSETNALLTTVTGTEATIETRYNLPLVLGTDATERARITSGGYFKASNDGTYNNATSTTHEFRASSPDGIALFIENTSTTTPYGFVCRFQNAAPNDATRYFAAFNDNTANRATIRSNGGLANYQANNVDLSDARTKNSITPAASMWAKVAALEIVTYKYNDQTHDDVNLGVIAQQVETVEPVWVDPDGFGETPEGEEPLKTVYTKDITFAAIKALQEAMARIEALEARLEALEA